ncbi:MAG: amidohydrolase, partial [Chloroflexota bacterium]
MTADIVIRNGAVYTVDEANPSAEAVAISGNKLIFVGDNEGVDAYISAETQVIDAAGKTVMPGFIDAHFHLLWGSESLAAAPLYGVTDLEELGTLLCAWADDHPGSKWILGSGTSYAVPSEKIELTRHHLDAIISDRPILLFSYDMHTVWLNTLGLKEVGLLHGHPELPGGAEVVMGLDGLATGALIEPAAYNLAVEKLPEKTEEQLLDMVRNGLAKVASFGITSIHDMTANAKELRPYGILEEQDELIVRIYSNQLLEPEHHDVADIERLAVPLRDRYYSDKLRVGFIKFFMDGVYESYSAVTLNGYPDQPDNLGEPIWPPKKFKEMAVEADRLGFQIAVHACGNGAVRMVLDGYEHAQAENGKRDSRHRVEHIEVVAESDIGRFLDLEVVASMQPLHSPIEENDPDIWPTRVAEEEWDQAYAWRFLQEAGIPMVFGSDWPVVTLNPMIGIHAAVNRKPWKPGHNSHNLTLEETIAGYTKDAAWVEFMEGKKGQLKVGQLADVIVLSENIFKIPAEDIQFTQVDMTIMYGR